MVEKKKGFIKWKSLTVR